MAANAVLSASATTTKVDDATQNPDRTNHRSVTHVTLIADGVTIDPSVILDALQAEYVVQGQKATVARGTYIFVLTALAE